MNSITTKPRGASFNDGCLRAKHYVHISGKIKGVDPNEVTFSRTYSCSLWNVENGELGAEPQWGYDDHPGWDIISVCYWSNTPFVPSVAGWNGARVVDLSRRGGVCLGAGGIPDVREQIPDVLGSVTQIRQIGERLYVCGMQGQVFRRDDDGWHHIDQGIFDPNVSAAALHLNGIDGTSDRDIFVVGLSGRVLHYDGTSWTELASPTNMHLERVLSVGPGEAYVCGNKGTFYRVENGSFIDYSVNINEDFWGMTSFQGKIYLATLEGLHVFDGKQVKRLDTKIEPAIGGYRLDSCEERLWSFGVDDLAWFDGTTWTRLVHPDNQ